MEDWTPDLSTFGWLEPPRRRPPTAIGVATPPPPHRPFRRTIPHRSRFHRITLVAIIALAASSAGVLAGIDLPLSALLEVGGGLTVVEAATWLVRARRVRLHRMARNLATRCS